MHSHCLCHRQFCWCSDCFICDRCKRKFCWSLTHSFGVAYLRSHASGETTVLKQHGVKFCVNEQWYLAFDSALDAVVVTDGSSAGFICADLMPSSAFVIQHGAPIGETHSRVSALKSPSPLGYPGYGSGTPQPTVPTWLLPHSKARIDLQVQDPGGPSPPHQHDVLHKLFDHHLHDDHGNGNRGLSTLDETLGIIKEVVK